MGHLLLCPRSMRAHAPHMHRWRQGSAVVSRGSLMHTTHSLPESASASASSSGVPVEQCSIPKISCSSYATPSTQIFCFSTETAREAASSPPSPRATAANVVCACDASSSAHPAGPEGDGARSTSRLVSPVSVFCASSASTTHSRRTISAYVSDAEARAAASPPEAFSSTNARRASASRAESGTFIVWPNPASRRKRGGGGRFSVSVRRLPSLGASLALRKTDTQHGRFASKTNAHAHPLGDAASRVSASESFFRLTWLRIVVVRVARSVGACAGSETGAACGSVQGKRDKKWGCARESCVSSNVTRERSTRRSTVLVFFSPRHS